MDITWYGQTCFQLKDRQTSLVIDPIKDMLTGAKPRFKADITAISNPNRGEMAEGQCVDAPGEYEMADIFVTAAYLHSAKSSQKDTAFRNNVFVIYMDDMVVCHLGHLDHLPNQNQVETLGNIEILIVPIGGHTALNANQAAEIISLIEPQVVIPMYYQLTSPSLPEYRSPDAPETLDPLEKFLKEMGLANLDTVDNLRISKSQLPEETQIILLEPKL